MITGKAAGVPFVGREPSGGPRPEAPVVVAWHLLDPPRTESAFAAALPLEGLDAWRFYLALPNTASRLPAGGVEEVMRRAAADILGEFASINVRAADEFPRVLAALREEFGLDADAPLGLVGGSAGSAIALEAITRGAPVASAVLISSVPRLAALSGMFAPYGFSVLSNPANDASTARMDYVARASELGATPIRAIVGADDDEQAVRAPSAELVAAVAGPSDLVTIEGMGHALSEEPGIEPAPQTVHAAAVDVEAVSWLSRLTG